MNGEIKNLEEYVIDDMSEIRNDTSMPVKQNFENHNAQ